MLVLSRRPNELILFPNLGIRVRVLRVKGRVADIGIEAGSDVKVLRGEVATSAEVPIGNPSSHTLRNRLNKVTLGLHRFHQLRQAGLLAEADESFQRVLNELDTLERDWSTPDKGHPAPEESSPLFTKPTKFQARPYRTLLVEDDDNERELLAGMLSMSGCECQTAADGQEALAILESQSPPDVILLDMGLPRVSGPEMLAHIRREQRFPRTKVFAVTGQSPESLGIPTGPEGVDAWFTKPLNPRHLWEAIMQAQ